MQTDYPALLACYKSGQISERQWAEHLADQLFVLWLDRVRCAKQS